MRPLKYSINTTVDGCCHHEAGMPDAEIHLHHARNVERTDAMILGRVTYQLMEYWRPPDDGEPNPDPFAVAINAAKKYVVSSTLKSVEWNSELLRGDPVEAVRALKELPGRELSVGGVTLPLSLADAGLIDEYEFVVYPASPATALGCSLGWPSMWTWSSWTAGNSAPAPWCSATCPSGSHQSHITGLDRHR